MYNALLPIQIQLQCEGIVSFHLYLWPSLVDRETFCLHGNSNPLPITVLMFSDIIYFQ